MPLGKVLYESGMPMGHVYFPTTSIVSLLYVMEDGASAEIAVVGNEGIVGIALFMGGETTPSRSVVQSAGAGYRMAGQLLKDEFSRSGPVLHLLLRYTQALITQMAQTAVCNPPPFARPAAVPLAAAEPRSPSVDRTGDDAGAHRQHAGRAPGRRHRGGLQPPARRVDPLPARTHHGGGSTRARPPHLRVLLGRQEGVRPLASAAVAAVELGPRRGSTTTKRPDACTLGHHGAAVSLDRFVDHRSADAQAALFERYRARRSGRTARRPGPPCLAPCRCRCRAARKSTNRRRASWARVLQVPPRQRPPADARSL